MGVYPLPRTRLIGALALVLMIAFEASAATAAVPPFELVRSALVQARQQQKTVTLDLRVAQTSGKLVEWNLSGTFDIGAVPERLAGDPIPLRLLWIAVLSADPIAELQKSFGLINAARATVGVQEQFVYVYGAQPAASVHRDLKRLAALSVGVDGHTWACRLTWDEARLTGVMVTRDGRTVLTARSSSTPPSRQTP